AGGRPPVARHHDAVGVADGGNGGAVGDLVGRHATRQRAPARLTARTAQDGEEGRPRVVVGSEGRQRHRGGGYRVATAPPSRSVLRLRAHTRTRHGRLPIVVVGKRPSGQE